MALFAVPDVVPAPRTRQRGRLGLGFLGGALVLGIVLSVLPSPYLIEEPGPVFNTLGTNPYDGKATPLITVSGHPTYPTSGSLDLLTVSVLGDQTSRPNWLSIVAAYFDPSKAVIPATEIYPTGVSNQQVTQQNTADMEQAQQSAVAAALVQQGHSVGTRLTVSAVEKGSPADGKLKDGDRIISINGTSLASDSDVDSLRALVTANGAKPAKIVVQRGGTASGAEDEPLVETITPAKVDGTYLLGIGASVSYTFPFKVDLKLADVGGPSAGQMFALGIIDKITPGELNGGVKVAGTGTIDVGGTVGPIGGIRQKLYGAKAAGATVFLAPASNCDEVTGHIPSGLSVYAVSTLDQSVNVLHTISTKGDTSKLARCPLR